MTSLERYFKKYRKNIVGYNTNFKTPYGKRKLLYADWAASGRLYKPIEEKMINTFGPLVANPHTEASFTGAMITEAYEQAQKVIKSHVNADDKSTVLITEGSGMTKVVNKFQRILGLRLPEGFKNRIYLQERNRPVVFVTHMEHHSNQLSWLETIADVVVVEPDENNLFSLTNVNLST